MYKKQFLEILHKYRQGVATEQEQRFIESYYDLFDMEPDSVWINEEGGKKIEKKILDEIWEKVQQQKSRSISIKKRTWIRLGKIAASILVLIATGIFVRSLLDQQNSERNLTKVPVQNAKDQIHAAGNKAILTLADGRQIDLDQAPNGFLAKQGRMKIVKLRNGLLTCRMEEAMTGGAPVGKGEKHSTAFNTISTPRGGEYEIVLADGSKVWLNAASSLRFPTAFAGKARRVEMHGEAYFEIEPLAHEHAKPFIVHVSLASGCMKVKVLGTHFNINAYGDEGIIKTTLTEGAIRISARHESRTLMPGEQAKLDKQTQNINITHVNVQEALAWREGLFYFKDANIKAIMREVARWYKVKIVYETNDLDRKSFSGIMSRYGNVDSLLERLELTRTIHFKREGRTITVMD